MLFWPFYVFKVWKNSLLKININFLINFERKKVFHLQKQSSGTVLSGTKILFIKIHLQPYYKRDTDTGVFL